MCVYRSPYPKLEVRIRTRVKGNAAIGRVAVELRRVGGGVKMSLGLRAAHGLVRGGVAPKLRAVGRCVVVWQRVVH